MLIASSLVTPGIGLIVWTTLVFLILLFLLGKFAWKPILKAVKEREQGIEESLSAAQNARKEMESLHSDHERLVKEAKAQRDQILKGAKETKDQVIAQAQETAKTEAQAIMAKGKEEIVREREQAFKQLKSEVAQMAIQAASLILKDELKDKAKQEALVEAYLKDTKFN